MSNATMTRLEAARNALIGAAVSYADAPDAETWRELCRAKATLDALLRVAR